MAMLTAFTGAYRAGRVTATPRRPRTPLAVRAGRIAARVLPSLAGLRTAALSVTGFGCLTVAAWTLSTAAGFAAAGLSLLVLEWLSAGDGQ